MILSAARNAALHANVQEILNVHIMMQYVQSAADPHVSPSSPRMVVLFIAVLATQRDRKKQNNLYIPEFRQLPV